VSERESKVMTDFEKETIKIFVVGMSKATAVVIFAASIAYIFA